MHNSLNSHSPTEANHRPNRTLNSHEAPAPAATRTTSTDAPRTFSNAVPAAIGAFLSRQPNLGAQETCEKASRPIVWEPGPGLEHDAITAANGTCHLANLVSFRPALSSGPTLLRIMSDASPYADLDTYTAAGAAQGLATSLIGPPFCVSDSLHSAAE